MSDLIANRLPLAALELTRSARHPRSYWLRLVPGGLTVVFVALVTGLDYDLAAVDPAYMADVVGGTMWGVTLFFQVATAFLAGPLLLGSSISGEKQNGTLDLLIIAEHRTVDIVASKGLVAFFIGELLILTCLPVQMFAALFGAIMWQDLVEQLAIVSAIHAAMCGVSLAISTWARRPGDALLGGMTFVVVWNISTFLLSGIQYYTMGGPVTAGLVRVNPILSLAGIGTPGGNPSTLAPFLISAAVICGLGAWIATVLLPRSVTETGGRNFRRKRRNIGAGRWAMSPAARLHEAAVQSFGTRAFASPWVVGTVVIASIIGFIPYGIGMAAIVLLILYDCTWSIKSARATGAMDLLLVTGEDSNKLAQAIFRVHLKRTFPIYVALLIVWLAYFYIGWLMMIEENMSAWYLILPIAGCIVTPALYWLCITSMGCAAATWDLSPAGSAFAMLVLFVVLRTICFALDAGIIMGAAFRVDSDASMVVGMTFMSGMLPGFLSTILLGCMTLVSYYSFTGRIGTVWRSDHDGVQYITPPTGAAQ